VHVTTPNGSSKTTRHDVFTYKAPPTITALSTATGPTKGGTKVTITGSGFSGITSVKFGGVSGTSLTVSSSKASLKVTAPKHAVGAVDVVVKGSYGAATLANGFVYAAPAGWSSAQSTSRIDYLDGVSCVSSTWCVGLSGESGYASDGTDIGATVASIFNGTSWSATTEIDGAGLYWVSCTSTSFCAAVGDGSYSLYDGEHWSTPVPFDANDELNSVSCTSDSFCAAADGNGTLYSFDGTSWTPQTVGATGLNLVGISCASSSLCIAVGNDADLDNEAFVYDGSNWTENSPSSTTYTDLFESVGCTPGTTECVAVGYEGLSVTYDAGTWEDQLTIPKGEDDVYEGISCPASGSCFAVGQFEAAAQLSGGKWTRTAFGGDHTLSAISCSSSTSCVVTGYDFNKPGSTYYVYS
jgi:hypothetical protein